MSNNYIRFMLAGVLAVTTLAGCTSQAGEDSSGQNTVENVTTVETTAETTEEIETVSESDADVADDSVSDSIESFGEELETLSEVDVDKGLFSVTITLPEEYVSTSTQEEVDDVVNEKGYKSGVLNDDGSVTYIMSKEQHKELMEVVEEAIDEELAEMIGSEDYPNVTAITHNDDFTLFTITTKNEELGLNETLSVLAFYTFGGMYSIYSGAKSNLIRIQFIVSHDRCDIYSILEGFNALQFFAFRRGLSESVKLFVKCA